MASYQTKYTGSFLSIDGSQWVILIQQMADSPFVSVGDLDFPVGSSPLEIEWLRRSQEECICGSVATLTLNSPGDRTYIDLYSVSPCEYRLIVKKGTQIFWSGTLDPEFYEEPYTRGENYDVRLTFSDFGVLDRIPFSGQGLVSVAAILSDALDKAGIAYNDIDPSMITTKVGTSNLQLSDLKVRSDNFVDEDGKAMSMYNVLEGVLQPLGIKVRQRTGYIYLYDLNGLYNGADTSEIVWCGEDQLLSSDVVYNNIVVTLSAYGSDPKSSEIEFTGVHGPEMINLTNDDPRDGEYWSFGARSLFADESGNVDFTIFLGDGRGLASKHANTRYYHIQPVLGGNESSGIAVFFYTGHVALSAGEGLVRRCMSSWPSYVDCLMKTVPIYIPALDQDQARAFALRLSLPMLLDARYNPFQDVDAYNEEANSKFFELVKDFFVPVKVELYDDEGEVIAHYVNSEIARGSGNCVMRDTTLGEWEIGAAAYDDCYLQWYDIDSDNGPGAIQGWKTNHQTAGRKRSKINGGAMQRLPAGQYIPYPPYGGNIVVSVYGGMTIGFGNSASVETLSLLSRARWLLFQTPLIEIIKNDIAATSIDTSDIEYSGLVNANAKEELSLSTICGTICPCNPAARAAYHYGDTNQILEEMSRAGRTTQVEQLLIGTLHSQFSDRKVKLSGTAKMDYDGLTLRTDAAMPSSLKLLCLSEKALVRESELYIEAVELRPDEYDTTSA